MEGPHFPDLTIRQHLSMVDRFLLLPIPLRPRNLPPRSILNLGLTSSRLLSHPHPFMVGLLLRSLSRRQRFMAALLLHLPIRHIESL